MSIENDNAAPGEEEEVDEDLDQDGEDQDNDGEGKDDKGDKGTKKREPETPEARKSRLERELKQHQKKHPDLYKEDKGTKKEPKATEEKEPKLDYGQKAFLISNDVKAKDEQALALRIMTETGKDLEAVLEGAYFKSELKSLREDNAAQDALPGTRRSKASSPSSVEYWVEKGGLPPNTPENRKLRTDIVNARAGKQKAGSQFTDHAVVGNA